MSFEIYRPRDTCDLIFGEPDFRAELVIVKVIEVEIAYPLNRDDTCTGRAFFDQMKTKTFFLRDSQIDSSA